jgi:ArsR family transcriptional regulator
MTDLCNEINNFGKSIGNKTRYRIIEVLLGERKSVNELVKITRLSQPLVSQHLKLLKNCNLVIDERRGQEIWYTVNTEYTLKLLKKLVQNIQKNKTK